MLFDTAHTGFKHQELLHRHHSLKPHHQPYLPKLEFDATFRQQQQQQQRPKQP
jgi:hypothetical protein